jgi:hypothetical protein
VSRVFSPEFGAALGRPDVHMALFFEGEFASGTLRLWSGLGEIEVFRQWVPAAVRRNLLRFTQEFDNPAWTTIIGGTGVAPIVTPNAGIAPDGTMTADQIVFNAGSGTSLANFSLRAQTVQGPGGQYRPSIWLRTVSGTAEIVVYMSAVSTFRKLTVTSEWQQFSPPTPNAVPAGNVTFVFGVRPGLSGSGAMNPSATVLAWGAQLDSGTEPTPHQRVDAGPTAFDLVGDIYSGAGNLLGVGDIDESRDIVAAGTTVGLSSVPPELIAAAISEAQQGAPGRIYLGLFERRVDGLFPIGDPVLLFAGLLNVPRLQGLLQGRINIDYENRLVDLLRPRELRYNDQTQKSLYPGDRAFEYVTAIQQRFGWVR